MLTIIAEIAQIITVVLVLPISAWRAWKSIDTRLDEQNERTIRIEAQFFKNGGSSMKDDVTVLKEGLANIKGHLGL